MLNKTHEKDTTTILAMRYQCGHNCFFCDILQCTDLLYAW